VLSKTVKKKCPITGLDEIVVTYPNPNELVATLRKTEEGKYIQILKPRKEVKGGLSLEVSCPSQGHPALDVSSPLGLQLWKEEKAWCRKTRKVCPIEKILQDLL